MNEVVNAAPPVSGFLERLQALSPAEWAEVTRAVAAASDRLHLWDDAWESAVRAGGQPAGLLGMAVARRAGAGLGVSAMAGGAAAGLAVRDRLDQDTFETLRGPFAMLIPSPAGSRGPVPATRHAVAAHLRRLISRLTLPVHGSRMEHGPEA